VAPGTIPVDVVALRWPEDAARRVQLAAAGVPRLLLVSPGATPPRRWAVDEDWVAAGASVEERGQREATVRRRLELLADPPRRDRCGVVVDADGLVRREGRWVALSDLEVRLVRPLLDAAGRCVSRAELLAAGWPGEVRPDRSVDGAIRRVRAKLRPLGVRIHGITGTGYLLEA
jgi:Transcriptional regulatory protein, C terminal